MVLLQSSREEASGAATQLMGASNGLQLQKIQKLQ